MVCSRRYFYECRLVRSNKTFQGNHVGGLRRLASSLGDWRNNFERLFVIKLNSVRPLILFELQPHESSYFALKQ